MGSQSVTFPSKCILFPLVNYLANSFSRVLLNLMWVPDTSESLGFFPQKTVPLQVEIQALGLTMEREGG